jgi:hypothetical protein
MAQSSWFRAEKLSCPHDRLGPLLLQRTCGARTVIDVDYPKILDLFAQHRAAGREDSVSFLIWYLENYYRLDSIESVDSVCDQPGDKGVDGIFVNENNQTITIFQSRLYQNPASRVGDSALRAFAGTLTQFRTPESIQALVASAGNAQVATLIKRLDLTNKITTHELRGEFVTNLNVDVNGDAFVAAASEITFIGKTLCKLLTFQTRGRYHRTLEGHLTL